MINNIPKDLFYPAIRNVNSGTTIYLGEQISSADTARNIDKGARLARELCQQIDDEIAPLLNRLAGTQKMRFALPLAGYKAQLQAIIYFNIAHELDARSTELTGATLECTDTLLDRCIQSRFRFSDVIKRMLPCCTIKIQPATRLTLVSASHFQRACKKVNLAKNNPGKAWNRVAEAFYVFFIRFFAYLSSAVGNKKAGKILMFPPYLILHKFGASAFKKYELFLCSERTFKAEYTTEDKNKFDSIADALRNHSLSEGETLSEQAVRSLLVDDILSEISYCLWNKNYLSNLICLRSKLHSMKIGLGIWSMPPISGFDSILFEFLRCHGIPVIGNQHGGPNECQHHAGLKPDLTLCTDFASWGCTEDDIARLSPQEHSSCRIHPLGWANEICATAKHGPDFDLLFPLTNTMHMFDGGLIREKPELLLEKQLRLLEYLEKLQGVRIAIKPFPNANQSNCGVYDKLTKLRNIKVFWNISLMSFIEKYRFRGIILEHPSKPLYEVLHLDAEIFLHTDSVLEIESLAFGELEQRVHCFHSIGTMIQAIDNFLTGKLPQRRDEQFYRHYVSRPGTKEKFLSLVDELYKGTLDEIHSC